MKRLYKIEIATRIYSRSMAIEAYKKMRLVRKTSGKLITTLIGHHLGVNSSVVDGIQRIKRDYYQAVERPLPEMLVRDGYRVGIDRSDGGLRGALYDIRRQIRQKREAQRALSHWIFYRRPNNVLNRYWNKLLEQRKSPKDNTEYIGIEIECIIPSRAPLDGLLPYAKYIDVGSDGSIQPGENESGREIRVCVKREDLRSVIPGLMDALQKLGARVNKSCGLHVHLDQRNVVDPGLSFSKLVRSLGLLYTVVPKSRRENDYCKPNTHSRWHDAINGNRYRAINASAYNRYKTIEVRLFGGTLSATKILNWIETLYAIVEGKTVMRCPKNFDTAQLYWKLSPENVAWLKARQEKFSALNALSPANESDTENNTPVIFDDPIQDGDGTVEEDSINYIAEEELQNV